VTKVKIVSLNQIYKSKITIEEIWMKTTGEESRVSINYLIPNKETIEAIRQAREENLEKFKTIEDLMNDLNSNNQQD
jgi:antitoxin component of RelBE/YafQ-DinJ toxin-antitoxin module